MDKKIPPPSGYGPWKVLLSTNVHPFPCKKTEIRVHTYCRLILCAMNAGPRDWWIPITEYGPFISWNAAVVFKDKWEKATRNLRNRIAKGWSLFKEYQHDYELVMWYQPVYKKQYMEGMGWRMPSPESIEDMSQATSARKLVRKYREMSYTNSDPRVSISSIQNVETKRKCLGTILK